MNKYNIEETGRKHADSMSSNRIPKYQQNRKEVSEDLRFRQILYSSYIFPRVLPCLTSHQGGANIIS